MGKTKKEVENMLKNQEIIELNLSERASKHAAEDDLKIFEYQ